MLSVILRSYEEDQTNCSLQINVDDDLTQSGVLFLNEPKRRITAAKWWGYKNLAIFSVELDP